MYTSEERVIRDGVLVAFAGEVMTDEEARRRGLLEETVGSSKTSRAKAKPAEEPAAEGRPADAQEGA